MQMGILTLLSEDLAERSRFSRTQVTRALQHLLFGQVMIILSMELMLVAKRPPPLTILIVTEILTSSLVIVKARLTTLRMLVMMKMPYSVKCWDLTIHSMA